MAMVQLDNFLPEVSLEGAGAPNPILLNAIRNACYDFCKISQIWRETQAPILTSPSVGTYSLAAPTDAQPLMVLYGTYDGHLIYPWVPEAVAAARPNWTSGEGAVEGFIQLNPKTVTFVAIPDKAGSFEPTTVLAPSRTATSVDDRLFDNHLETIKEGALWKLKKMVNQSWSDPAGAMAHMNLFLTAAKAAALDVNRGNGRAELRVEPRSF